MIFRWSFWGRQKRENLELLRYSILSFRKHFQDHRYVVGTDDAPFMRANVGDIAEIIAFDEGGESIFDLATKATWRKWCPRVKLYLDQTEIYIDSDVYLVSYPVEIEEIIEDPKIKFAILDEFSGQPWQHGAMRRKASRDTPFVNAGLFIQKAGASIAVDLEEEFYWWKRHIPQFEHTHHDEQGALAIALAPYLGRGELAILPKNRYLLIGPNENSEIVDLDGVVMFHAVYPDHPAFYKFKGTLDILLAQP